MILGKSQSAFSAALPGESNISIQCTYLYCVVLAHDFFIFILYNNPHVAEMQSEGKRAEVAFIFSWPRPLVAWIFSPIFYNLHSS